MIVIDFRIMDFIHLYVNFCSLDESTPLSDLIRPYVEYEVPVEENVPENKPGNDFSPESDEDFEAYKSFGFGGTMVLLKAEAQTEKVRYAFVLASILRVCSTYLQFINKFS